MYVYIQTEFAGRDYATNNLYTVGFYGPSGEWNSDSDHSSKDEAAQRVAWLNGSR